MKLHPWSQGFEWRDHTGPLRLLTEAQRSQFDQDGYVVLADMLSPDQLDAVVEEIDAFEAAEEERLLGHGGRQVISEAGAITFTTHLVARSEGLRKLASSEPFTSLCHDLVGPDVRLYWDQAVYKKPEKPRRFPWHQDNGYTFVEPEAYLTCWVALTDATEDNGCPQVVPGLHRGGTLRHRYVDPLGFECFDGHLDAVVAPVGAGGMVAFSSLTPHLTGPNLTDSVRKAYILQYAPDGAQALRGQPPAEPIDRVPCRDPHRQFLVLQSGKPLS